MYCYSQPQTRNPKPETEQNRPTRTEPNRLILEPAGTGRGNVPNRTEPNRTEPRRVRKTQAEQRRIGN